METIGKDRIAEIKRQWETLKKIFRKTKPLIFFSKRLVPYNLFLSLSLISMITAYFFLFGATLPVPVFLKSLIPRFFIYSSIPAYYGSVFLFSRFHRNEWIFYYNLGFSIKKLVLQAQLIYLLPLGGYLIARAFLAGPGQ